MPRIIILLALATACLAQPRDSWLDQNYRFTGPPAETPPVSPVIAQLTEIQNATLSIMRKADFAGDYEAALAAAAQATATAQLLGTVTGQLKPPAPPRPNPAPAHYLLAFRDGTSQTVTALWTDHLMVHYTTAAGAHEQVRPDRIDWQRTLLQRPGISDRGQIAERLAQVPLPH